jgi:hypothetical protein
MGYALVYIGKCWQSLDFPGKLRGLDHGVGHSLLPLYDAKAHRGKNSNYFNGL